VTLGRITVEGGELHYEIAGAGRPVVLLHSGAMTSRMWDREFELLTDGHTVIRYDARNHGRSTTATEPYAHYDDLRLLLDGLGIERAGLVGVSLGSRTAVDFALTWPDRVERLVLNSPGVSGMTHRDPFILDQQERMRAATGLQGVVTPIMRMWVDGPLRTPEQVDPTVRGLCHEMMTETISRHAAGWRVPPTEVGAIDRLAELAAPTTVVLGDLDSADIADVAQRLTERDELVTVEDAGHVVNLEQPERFAEILLKSV
jgi:pimeloyl-ACP methyl ester carboxylesterase